MKNQELAYRRIDKDLASAGARSISEPTISIGVLTGHRFNEKVRVSFPDGEDVVFLVKSLSALSEAGLSDMGEGSSVDDVEKVLEYKGINNISYIDVRDTEVRSMLREAKKEIETILEQYSANMHSDVNGCIKLSICFNRGIEANLD